MTGELKRAATMLAEAGEAHSVGEFEDLLAHQLAFHKTAASSLAEQADDAVALNSWFGLYLSSSDKLRGDAVNSLRKFLFAPERSLRRPSNATNLYKALRTPPRRLEFLDNLMLVSRVAFAAEVLRRHSGLDEPSSFLCWAGVQNAELVLEFAGSLVDWSSAARQHRREQGIVHQKFNEEGFRVIDIYGAFRAIHLDADAAWMQLQAGSAGDVTHEKVIALYERCLAFLRPTTRSSWPLRELTECLDTDSLSDIINGVLKQPVRIGVDEDGKAMRAVRELGAAALKPLVVAGVRDVKFVVLLTNSDFLLKEYPTADALRAYEGDPAGFLKKHVAGIPSSQLARMIQIQIDTVNRERLALAGVRKAKEVAMQISPVLIAGLLVERMSLPPETKDLIESVIEALFS